MIKEFPFEKIGEKLKFLRGDITQEQFASTLGISTRSVQRYESGERLPDFMTLIKISAFCEIDIKTILSNAGESEPAREAVNVLMDQTEKFVKGKGKNLIIGNLIELQKNLRIKREQYKSQLGVPHGTEEKYYLEPRLSEAINAIRFVFSYGSESLIKDTLGFLNTVAGLASFGFDLKEKRVPRRQRKQKLTSKTQHDK